MKNEHDLKQFSTQKYLFAIATLFLVSISLLFIQKKIIESHTKYAHLINISGRQRMLSQKISLLVYEINIAGSSSQSKVLHNELNESFREFNENNLFLSSSNKQFGPHLNHFSLLINKALLHKDSLLELSEFAKHQLLPELNNVVVNFEEKSNAINKLQQNFLYVVLFSLCLLILAGTRFIFLPLQAIYHKTFIQFTKALKTLEEERIKAIYASKMATLGEMASGIAHEINNPLTVIQGMVKLLQRQAKENAVESKPFENSLEKIELMSIRISKIVKSLSAFSRNSDNDPMTETSMKKIVSETLELCMDRFRRSDIHFEMHLEEDFAIYCREVQLSQVLLNLFNNSIDAIHNRPEKWVRLNAIEKNYSIEISVTDCGSGISKELGERIMQPFFTTKEKGKGTGLGLSISKAIVKEHFGEFLINYELSNTQFVIRLPKREFFCLYPKD